MTNHEAIEKLVNAEYADKWQGNEELTLALHMAIDALESKPVQHGYWIECDWKHLEHGMLESDPNAGLCCSVCRTAFQKKKMTYKEYCPACGAKMGGGEIEV